MTYDYPLVNKRSFLKDFNKMSLSYTTYDKPFSDFNLSVNKHVPPRTIAKRELENDKDRRSIFE